jgi:malate dehydrogenase (oxaloacetate-decarboxylating)(NADP+)
MRKITPDDALEYHHLGGKPGKLAIVPTKPMSTQHDLALAYTPGVAVPVLEIARQPDLAYEYTAKGNLVAVISNGTAILGLGDRGALVGKPVPVLQAGDDVRDIVDIAAIAVMDAMGC